MKKIEDDKPKEGWGFTKKTAGPELGGREEFQIYKDNMMQAIERLYVKDKYQIQGDGREGGNMVGTEAVKGLQFFEEKSDDKNVMEQIEKVGVAVKTTRDSV